MDRRRSRWTARAVKYGREARRGRLGRGRCDLVRIARPAADRACRHELGEHPGLTVSPTRTVVVGGTNAEPWMFTELVAASASSGRASNPHEITTAAAQTTTARLTAILYGSCRPARSPRVH